ncbi:acetyltransferase [Pseudomonas sp. ZM23]|uniref:GNAT family N-acetyltransferase n=1 Tax=Pseudomonas triclosanedens TaxID=2961893 RepID=A0ABY7A837_9PSED|nr:GNAT family N-acetyltransferase [Pseudomonas triclosanedens]MCP8466321.1 acetyltransferase [Pseudomonas triclosanedens]MCP8471847.1 acetyltransferase [Pseudomonas triclosanedens]MCP8478542.1 acetyltransferase [Pseudomonas triclosanedens]WAI52263.1 GNAT family N-acetyltransferase [Pseudomonas triclosanedens]
MTHSAPLHSLPLPDGRRLSADCGAGSLVLSLDDRPLLVARREGDCWQLGGPASVEMLWAMAYWAFASDAPCQRVRFTAASVATEAFSLGLASRDEIGGLQLERAAFWQLPGLWLQSTGSAGYPQVWRMNSGRRHPLRAPKPQGEVYRRFDARLGQWISLRTLDVELDLERFNRWQNSPRVLEFWQEGGSLEQHRAYLEKLAQAPHTTTLIGCIDDEPFAYYEAYWAKEDRIAPFYEVDDYDRGIHMLVGEEHHRGPHKVESWLTALVHYLLLDDPRTRRIVAEPRADNARMIGHMQRLGFCKEKEFDFPHKRAALMVQSRETFFERCALC